MYGSSPYGRARPQSGGGLFSSPTLLAAATAALGALGLTAYMLYTTAGAKDTGDAPTPRPAERETKKEEAVGGAAATRPVPRELPPSTRAASAEQPPALAASPPAVAPAKKEAASAKKKDEEDDDDLFAVADGPRLFAPSASFPQKSKSASVAAPGAAARPPAGTTSKHEPVTDDIVERTKVLNLVRVLLSRIDGVEVEASDTESDSDETDVSLNFHIATELEAGARDELMGAFDDYEASVQEAAASGDEEAHLEDLATVLVKIAEYLDISNEREKLRIRRELLHEEQGRRGSLPTAQEVEAELTGHGAGYREALAAQAKQLEAEYTTMDRMLHARDDEKFEDEWGDEDQEEADFMAYLQQEDSAPRTYTRREMRERKEAVHVEGPDGRRYSQTLATPAGAEDEEEEYEDIEGEEGEEGEEDEESGVPEPWEDEEKLEFEGNLYDRIYELAETWGVTRAMGEREGVATEEARRLRREGRAPAAAAAAAPGDEDPEDEEGEWYDDDDEEYEEEEWYEEEEEEEVEPPPLRPAAPVPFAASRSLAKGGSPAGVVKSVSPPNGAHGRKGPAPAAAAPAAKAAVGKGSVTAGASGPARATTSVTKSGATATGTAATAKFSRK